MAKVDWYYYRPSWSTCAKTQEFLAKHKITANEQLSTKAATLSKKEALDIVKNIDELYAAKGRQVVHLDLRRDKPNEATLSELLIGRTGNLRAPTLRQGRTLIVGFDEATYKRFFK